MAETKTASASAGAAAGKAAHSFRVGDTVVVHVKIREGDKERIQPFRGVVIGRRGRTGAEMFTVRKISHGVGVERIFPIDCPSIVRIEVESSARVRRAKLYYLRRAKGKATRLEEKIGGAVATDASAAKATEGAAGQAPVSKAVDA